MRCLDGGVMARARNIKPGFFTNEDLVELDFATRLLFVGLWTVADRDGRLQDRPKKIKIDVFPADNLDVDAMLQALHNGGFIARYEVNGGKFIQITNWTKHQNPHHTEKASDIPSLNGEVTVKPPLETLEPQKHDSEYLADSLIPDSGFTDSLIPDSPKRAARKPTATGVAVRFDDFWNAWPKSERKQDKAKCSEKWKAAKLDDLISVILADIATKKLTKKWQEGFIEAPEVYLNNRRWEDGVTPDEQGENGVTDPDSRAAVEAEGIAKGIGPWDQTSMQWHVYKAKVRGVPAVVPGVRKSGFTSVADAIGGQA
jgi:hypothetical protein